MRYVHVLLLTLLGSFLLAACANDQQVAETSASEEPAAAPAVVTISEYPAVPQRAEDVDPVDVGAPAPSATLRTPAGEPVDLDTLYAGGPTLLVFYRGGWCPYCNAHLGQLSKIDSQLQEMGVQILAVSPDRPEALQTTSSENDLSYQLLSDSEMQLAKAFGLAFRVDDETVTKYQEYGIDLAKASGQSHQLLPVPAAYLIDRDGVVRFAQWNPDYTTRVSDEEVLAAARDLVAE